MNVIHAKCPNCWETDDCTIEEAKADMQTGGQSDQSGSPSPAGHTLKCPTCKTTFWHEIRGEAKSP